MKLQIKIIINAVSAKKGMVMKPSQFIYSVEQGIKPHAGTESEKVGTF